MTNKFSIISLIFFLGYFFQNLESKELNINAKTLDINKSNEIINAEGAVEVIDSLNNIINSQRIKYDKIKQILNTYGETEILTSEKFKIKGKDIVYDNNSRIVSSKNKTEITDKDGNLIKVDMFNYIVDKGIFLSTGEIKIIDKKNNEYYFTEIYIDEKKGKIVGSDIRAFLNDGSFKYDPRNEPRFFTNSATISEKETIFTKGVFTACKNRDKDKCINRSSIWKNTLKVHWNKGN